MSAKLPPETEHARIVRAIIEGIIYARCACGRGYTREQFEALGRGYDQVIDGSAPGVTPAWPTYILRARQCVCGSHFSVTFDPTTLEQIDA